MLISDIHKQCPHGSETLTLATIKGRILDFAPLVQRKPNDAIGHLYLIQDENKYVNNWKLGPVIGIHSRADGLVRVVTLKTQNGRLKRTNTKLLRT